MKFSKLTTLVAISAIILFPAAKARAVQLLDMQCVTTKPINVRNYQEPEVFVKHRVPIDIFIGRENLPEIAYLRTFSSGASGNRREGSQIVTDFPAEFSCRLTRSFQTLNLVFGLDDSLSNERQLLELEVFAGNNLIANRRVAKGSVQSLSVNVTNARSLTIAARCVRKGGPLLNDCPLLSFVDMSLK